MADTEVTPDSADADNGGTRSFAQRLLAPVLHFRERPLRNSLLIGGLTLATIVTAGLLTLGGSEEAEPLEPAAEALAALDEGKWGQARTLALRLHRDRALEFDQLGVPPYILGAVMAHDAQESPDPRIRQRLYAIAAGYFEEADKLGMPTGRELAGKLSHGTSLFESQQFVKSLQVLSQIVDRDQENRSAIHEMMSVAHLRSPLPNLTEALRYNRLYLTDRMLTDQQRHLGQLERSEILLRQANSEQDVTKRAELLEEFRKTADLIPDNSSLAAERVLLQARALMTEAKNLVSDPTTEQAGIARYRTALEKLKSQAVFVEPQSDTAARIHLHIGRCYAFTGDLPAAEVKFSQVRRRHFKTPAGIAASFGEAEVLHRLQRDDDAVQAFQRAVQEVGDANQYRNRWYPLERVQRTLDSVLQAYRSAEAFAHSAAIARLLQRVGDPVAASVLLGESLRDEAAAIRKSVADPLSPDGKDALRKARQKFRAAADVFRRLAEEQTQALEYTEYLWSSAENYLSGQNYPLAETMLNRYVANETRRRRPRALTALGEIRIATNDLDGALKPLTECIQFNPRHPQTYRARMLASKVHAIQGEWEKARQLLAANLNHDLTPESREWQESLFDLGTLYYREASRLEAQSRTELEDQRNVALYKQGLKKLEQSFDRFQKAIRFLTEAVTRYPTAGRASLAGYMVADSYRRSSRWWSQRLIDEAIATNRRTLARERMKALDDGLIAYDNLIKALSPRQKRGQLTTIERQVLRNCFFHRGDVLIDLAEYDQAIEAFSTVTNLFPKDPASIEAFVQIANCYRLMDRPKDAIGILNRAKIVFQRIRPMHSDEDFLRTTRYDIARWEKHLDWLGSL